MRNLKRVLSLALAVVMVIGMMVMTTGAADFTDADEIKYTEAVAVMSGLKVLEGYNGTYNPAGELYRDQAAKIICYMLMGPDKAVALEGAGTGMFNDTKGLWSEGYIEYCANLGIVDGWNGNFAPGSKLSAVQFGKMLLCALGYDAEGEGYNGDSWKSNIFADMIELGLDLEGVAADDILTREQAAQMAFQALQCTMVYYDGGMNVTTSDGVTVTVGATRYNKANTTTFPDTTGEAGMQFCERYFPNMAKNTVKNVDAYGRPGYTWEVDNKVENDVFIADEPLVVYTSYKNTTAGKKAVAADLKGYTITAVPVITDGKANGTVGSTNAIAALTNGTEIVEVYVNKQAKAVTGIVEIVTYADTVATVTEADEENDIPASITLTGGLTFETEAFEQGDVVTYTKLWNPTLDVPAFEIVAIEEAESFTGTMTSYNSYDEYTINGEEYELSFIANCLTTDDEIATYIGVEKVYHLDSKGYIIDVSNPASAAPVVIKDYVIVLDSKLNFEYDAWSGAKKVSAQVKAVMSDGTSGTFDLPLTKLTADITALSLEAGDYVAFLGTTPVEIVDKAATTGTAGTSALTALVGTGNKVFTYALNGTELNLAAQLTAFDGTETRNGVKLGTNDAAAIDKDSVAIASGSETVVANEKTVFVLKTATGYTVKTGVASLAGVDSAIAQNQAVIITNVTAGVDENGDPDTSKNVYVATVVFALDKAYAAAGAANTNDMVYVDGSYVVTKDTDGSSVYTYTVVKADGSRVDAEGAADLDKGIYVLKTDGTIGSPVTTFEAWINQIIGTTCKLGSYYETVNGDTVTVVAASGASFEVGAKCFYKDIDSDGVVDLLFVSKKAQ